MPMPCGGMMCRWRMPALFSRTSTVPSRSHGGVERGLDGVIVGDVEVEDEPACRFDGGPQLLRAVACP